jgi:hypothetical protein
MSPALPTITWQWNVCGLFHPHDWAGIGCALSINQFNPILTHAYRGIAPLEGNVQICPNWRVIIDFLAPLLDNISPRIDD